MGFMQEGLVVKVKKDHCIVLTRDGAFKKAPLPPGGTRVGMEISYRTPVLPGFSRPLMIAASFLILCLGLTLLRPAVMPLEALAYVSLDIYPNLELAVDRDLKVVDVKFDDNDKDMAELIRPDELRQENLYAAVRDVVKRAVDNQRIKPGQDSLIVSTVTVTDPRAISIDPVKLKQSLESASDSVTHPEEVRVYTVTGELRAAAQASGLSSGRYIVYKQLQQAGLSVTVNDVQSSDLQQLVASNDVDLLPDNKKLGVKKQSNSKEMDLYVEDNDKPAATPGKSTRVTPGRSGTVTPGWPSTVTPGEPGAVTPEKPATVTPGWPTTVTPGWPYTATPGKSQDSQDVRDDKDNEDDKNYKDNKGQDRDSKDDRDDERQSKDNEDDKGSKRQSEDPAWDPWKVYQDYRGIIKQPATDDDSDDDDKNRDDTNKDTDKDKDKNKEAFFQGRSPASGRACPARSLISSSPFLTTVSR